MSSNQQQQEGDGKGSRVGGGAGGKSLALMQQRLLPSATSAEVPTPSGTLASVPSPQPSPSNGPQRPGKSAANLIATQAKQLATAPSQSSHPITTQPQSLIPPGRPKGKDFAAMAKSVGSAPKTPVPAPAPTPTPTPVIMNYPPSLTPNPMQQQDQQGPGGRPKGKDFAAMANRMGAPPPTGPTAPLVQTPAPSPMQSQTSAHSAAQAARAAQMQAAARAAAGYTPNQRLQPANAPAPPPLNAPTQVHVSPAAAAIAAEARHQHMNKLKAQTGGPLNAAPASNKRTSSISSTGSGSTRPSMTNQRSASFSNMIKPPTTAAPVLGPPSITPSAQPSSWEAKLAFAGPGSAHASPMVGQRLRDLVASLDPNYTLDAEAEEQVLQLADDFLEKVTKQSMRLAQHRGSKTLDAADIQLTLAKQWGIIIPGLGAPNLRPSKPGNRSLVGAVPPNATEKSTKRGLSTDTSLSGDISRPKLAKMDSGEGVQPTMAK